MTGILLWKSILPVADDYDVAGVDTDDGIDVADVQVCDGLEVAGCSEYTPLDDDGGTTGVHHRLWAWEICPYLSVFTLL